MFWSIILTVFLVAVVWKLLKDEENPVDKVPGPPRYPIIGNMLEFIKLTPEELFDRTRYYAATFKDRFLVKILKRRVLQIYNPGDIELVLSHSKNITKNKPYTFLQPWLGTGLLLSTGKKWHNRRKILTPTFHFNVLKSFGHVMEEKSRHMVNKLKQHQEIEVDLFPAVSEFTLNTICETAMGTQLDQDQSETAVEYKSAILDIGSLVVQRLIRVWLYNDLIFYNTSTGKHFQKALNKVLSFADSVILERKKQRMNVKVNKEDGSPVEEAFGSKKRLAMLDLLLEAESKGEIDLEGIREEVNTFMFEGHDTTATALNFGLMLLAEHPDIQDRIYEECQSVVGNSDRELTMADMAEMKYLEAVIKEVLRLYPSVPFIGREITEDFMMGDILVKKGTEVLVRIFDLHRRKDIYPEPEAFKPERFLNGEARHPYAFVPFSAGPRNCIGQRFAMQEMKCLLSEIVRNFRLEAKVKGWRPALAAELVLRTLEPVHVKFIRR